MTITEDQMETDDPRFCECRVYYQYDCGAIAAAEREITALRHRITELAAAAHALIDSATSQSWYDEEGIIKYIVDETDWHEFVHVLAQQEAP